MFFTTASSANPDRLFPLPSQRSCFHVRNGFLEMQFIWLNLENSEIKRPRSAHVESSLQSDFELYYGMSSS